MKRRQAIRSILSLPAITALPALAQQEPNQKTDQTKPPAQEKLPPEMKPTAVEETPKLAMTAADAVAPGAPGFFTATQLATLRRLGDLLMPPLNGKPGASGAGVPEFLDFLIGESPQDRQTLYRNGLDRLEAESRRRYARPFTETSAAQSSELLAPLQQGWTFQGPPDPFGRFLHAAKEDVLRATFSSREWASMGSERRRSGGVGSYWYALS